MGIFELKNEEFKQGKPIKQQYRRNNNYLLKYYKFKIKLLDPSTFNTINHQHSTANPDPQPTHCHHNQHPSKNQPHSEKKKKKNFEREASLVRGREGGRGQSGEQNPSNPRFTVATTSKTHQTQDPRWPNGHRNPKTLNSI